MASAVDQLTGLSNTMDVIDRLFGGGKGTTQTTKTSGGTVTRGKDITEEGMQNIINKYLAGPGGVKDISGAARGAGLYNSSTEALLRNDLAARVAGEAAERGAKEITTTSPMSQTTTMQQTGGISPMTSLAGIAGAKVLGSLLEDTDILGSVSKGIGGLLGGGASAASSAPSLVGSIASGGGTGLSLGSGGLGLGLGSLGSQGGSILSSLGSGLGAGSGASSFLSDISMPGFSAATDVLQDLGSLGATGAGADLLGSLGIGEAGGLAGLNMAALNPISSLVSGLFGQNAFENPLSLGLNMLGGGLALGPMGVLAAPVLNLLGSSLGGLSVICTALMKRGLLDAVEYSKGEAYLRTLSPYTVAGYYLWGTKVARAIDNGSPWAIAISLPWAHSRMKLMSSQSRWKYIKYPLGTVTQFIGQPLCWLLGAAIKLTGEGYGRLI